MAPTQVCVLLLAVLAAGRGAPLARSAPAAAATPRLPSAEETVRRAGQGLAFGRRLNSAADTSDGADGQTPRPRNSPVDEQKSLMRTDGVGRPPRPPRTAPTRQRATARPGVPTIERSVVSRRRTGRREAKIAPTVSTQIESRATKPSDGFGPAKTSPSSRAASGRRPGTRRRESRPARPTRAPRPDRAGRSTGDKGPAAERRAGPLDVEQEASGSSRVLTYHVQHTEHSRVAKSPRESPDFFVPPIRRRPSRRRVPLSAQTQHGEAGSGRSLGALLAQQVRRQLAELEAQQEQQKQQQTAGSTTTTTEQPYQPPFVPTAPATTSKPYQHPFIPSSPTTTSEPYMHPFIPSPPTTTSQPYVHPFIPSAPTTTSEPYRHPFIPSSPTTTSEPYRHPHIPVPPESTRRPRVGQDGTAAQPEQQQQEEREQRQEKERQRLLQEQEQQEQEREQLQEQQEQKREQEEQQRQLEQEQEQQRQQQQQQQQRQQQQSADEPVKDLLAQERPQARRVPSGSAAVPRLHLPRKPAPTAARPASSTPPPPPTPAAPQAATIVHQQKVEAGYIVGEYGELGHSGGTVRGVKYAAESSVDRSLLEAALRQFLEL